MLGGMDVISFLVCLWLNHTFKQMPSMEVLSFVKLELME